MTQTTAFLLHVTAFFIYAYSIIWTIKYLGPFPWDTEKSLFAGRWKYLTNWDLDIQCLYFGLSILNDLHNFKIIKFNKLNRIRQIFFHSLAFPLANVVFSTFWILYSIDRELILPKALDPYFPFWLNHSVHTIIAPFIVAESYLVYSQIPPTKLGLKILYSLVVVYGLWTLFIGIYVGHWIYPFYNVLNWPQRAAVMLVIASYFSVFYFGGVKLHQLFWPSNRVKKLRAKVK